MDRDPVSPRHIDVRIKPRDPFSLELKFLHLLDPTRKQHPRRKKIRTRIAFFLPYSFGIRPETYNPEEFFDDTKLYLRFNTPQMTVEQLVDSENQRSPLTRLNQQLNDQTMFLSTELEHEARMLGAIVKSALRNRVTPFLTEVRKRTQEHVDSLVVAIAELDNKLDTLRRYIRRDADTLVKLRFVDEYISLTIEDYLTRIIAREPPGLDVQPLRRIIVAQNEYRKKMGYPSIVSTDDPPQSAEEYIYRSKLLKRYVSAVLFFEINRGNQAKRVEQILYGFAAGIAMAIATGISFFGQVRFGALSSTLFLILVIAYVIKDRLKDIMRSLFHRTLGRLFFDRRTKFSDPVKDNSLGVVKERVAFLRRWQIDEKLHQTRATGGFEKAIAKTNPESTLEYSKLISIKERKLSRTHRRLDGVADINIFDLKGLLRHLAKQNELIPMFDGDSITVEERTRIYHLNLVLSSGEGKNTAWEKIRLIVDAKGIRRIERPE